MTHDSGANAYLVQPVSFEGLPGLVKSIGDDWLTIIVGPPTTTS